MMTFIRCAVVALMLAPVPGVAEDFDTGNAAAQAGDFATALQVFRQLAEQGSARAQHRLGTHYRKGIGVPQDYAEALRWYQMAAEQRNTDAQHGLGS
ncbi:MAG: sel1 repeat family protein, partial [Marinobacter sp.]